RYVTVISHSRWNNERVWPPEMTHDWRDVQALGVTWVQIADQNRLLNTKTDWSPWHYMCDSAHAGLQLVWERLMVMRLAAISDARMAYFLLTGDEDGTPQKLRQFLGSWASPGGSWAKPVAVQAESGVLHLAVRSTSQPGYLGTGYVDYQNVTGSYDQVIVSSP